MTQRAPRALGPLDRSSRVRAGAAGWLLAALAALGVTGCGADVSEEIPQTSLDVVAVHPRADGFNLGLELLEDGRLLHSTGLRGDSEIRIEDLDGSAIERQPLPDDEFGEGATLVGDTACQLTWRSGVVHTWTLPALEPGPDYGIETEGWGLCHDESRDLLWLSDGSSRLHELGLPDLDPAPRSRSPGTGSRSP